MALVLYAVCDGCSAIVRGDDYPQFWPAYTAIKGVAPERFCTDECARMHLVGEPLGSARLKRLGLKSSDVQLLKLLGVGKSNKEIAIALGLVETTVKNRITVMFAQLGAQDRLQAVLLAHGLAIINLNVLATEFLAERRQRGERC